MADELTPEEHLAAVGKIMGFCREQGEVVAAAVLAADAARAELAKAEADYDAERALLGWIEDAALVAMDRGKLTHENLDELSDAEMAEGPTRFIHQFQRRLWAEDYEGRASEREG